MQLHFNYFMNNTDLWYKEIPLLFYYFKHSIFPNVFSLTHIITIIDFRIHLEIVFNPISFEVDLQYILITTIHLIQYFRHHY